MGTFFVRLFRPNLNVILGQFYKALSELDRLAKFNNRIVAGNNVTILRLTRNNNSLDAQTAKAERIAKRLRELIEE